MIREKELIDLIKDLTDNEPCALDHKGFCQTHGWMAPECPHAKAKRIIKETEKESIPIPALQLICALNGTMIEPEDSGKDWQIRNLVSGIPIESIKDLVSRNLIERFECITTRGIVQAYCLTEKGRMVTSEYC